MKYQSFDDYRETQQPLYDEWLAFTTNARNEGFTCCPTPGSPHAPSPEHWTQLEVAEAVNEAFQRGQAAYKASLDARERDAETARAFLSSTGWDARTATAMFKALLVEQEAEEALDADY